MLLCRISCELAGCVHQPIVGSGQTNLSHLYFSRLSLAMPAKLNFFKTSSSRPVSTSTGISGCYQPHRQTAMPGQKSIYETFLESSSPLFSVHSSIEYRSTELLLRWFWRNLQYNIYPCDADAVLVSQDMNYLKINMQDWIKRDNLHR
jgi:hypothetical protein